MTTALAVIEAPALPATVVQVERNPARAFAMNEKAASSRRAYRSDFAIFTTWCRARGLEPLPASTDTVAAFLAAQATEGAKASTIGRRAAAIRYAHRLAGHEPPTGSESVKAVMRGIRLGRQFGQRPKSDRLPPKVLALIRQGRSYRLIGREVGLSKNTVAGIVKRSRLPQPAAAGSP